MLAERVYADLDGLLGAADAALRERYAGDRPGRQPVHTVYVPADRFHADVVSAWRSGALAALEANPPLPFPEALRERVFGKLDREPIEDLRIDFEDGYGVRDDAEEDEAARAAAEVLGSGAPMPPFVGLRSKSLEAATRRRAIRTLDVFLATLGPALPDSFVITLPKVSVVEQGIAMVALCRELESAHGLPEGRLRFEAQIETPPVVLAADGTATVARLIAAVGSRLTGLHYGTYDYSAACGIAAGYQRLDHPAADHAKAVLQVAAAGTGVRLSDGSLNQIPVGDSDAVHAAWRLHARLIRRSLVRGYYQGWDLHPAQLPTRFGATYAFFRDGLPSAVARLRDWLDRRESGVLDEPATARALAGFLRRGVDCGAVDLAETGLDRATLDAL